MVSLDPGNPQDDAHYGYPVEAGDPLETQGTPVVIRVNSCPFVVDKIQVPRRRNPPAVGKCQSSLFTQKS